jgi:hypothetical protein
MVSPFRTKPNDSGLCVRLLKHLLGLNCEAIIIPNPLDESNFVTHQMSSILSPFQTVTHLVETSPLIKPYFHTLHPLHPSKQKEVLKVFAIPLRSSCKYFHHPYLVF